jgi:hypothetical protein
MNLFSKAKRLIAFTALTFNLDAIKRFSSAERQRVQN